MQYYSTLKAKLIYIFTIPDEAHSGCVKIGEATLDEATNLTLPPNCKELNAAARKRTAQYTKTADTGAAREGTSSRPGWDAKGRKAAYAITFS